jgi:hypothetical protein
MDQSLLPREASGSEHFGQRSPNWRSDRWVSLSQDNATQAEMRHVFLADVVVMAREMAAVADRNYAVSSFKLGLVLMGLAAVAAAVTLLMPSPILSGIAAVSLFAGCYVAARAVEIYRSVR